MSAYPLRSEITPQKNECKSIKASVPSPCIILMSFRLLRRITFLVSPVPYSYSLFYLLKSLLFYQY